jgi:hypothetical protein
MKTQRAERAIDREGLALNRREDMSIRFEQVAGTTALVVDDVYRDPACVRGVVLSLTFQREAGAYPGYFAFVSISSQPMLDPANDLMREHIGHELAFTPFYQDDPSFALVTKRGVELSDGQRRPHRDGFCASAGRLPHRLQRVLGDDPDDRDALQPLRALQLKRLPLTALRRARLRRDARHPPPDAELLLRPRPLMARA